MGDIQVRRGIGLCYAAAMWTLLLLQTAMAQPRPDFQFQATSSVYPIKVHWDRAQDEPTARRVMQAAELSWRVQVDELGFRAPVLPDGPNGGYHGPELDYYLGDLSGTGSYAFASPDWLYDVVTGDGYSGTGAYMAVDRRVPDAYADALIAHEFNHVLQYATDFNELTLTVWEATATMAQTWTVGESGNWDNDVADFQSDPYVNTLCGDSYYTWEELGTGFFYEYGAALWMAHLDQVVGSGSGSAGPEIWEALAQEGTPNEPDVIEAFAVVAGEELGPALNKLARTRFLVGDDWDPRGLERARDWPVEAKVPAVELDVAALPYAEPMNPPLQPTGMGFIDLDLSGIPDGQELVVQAASETQLRTGLMVLWWSDTEVGEEEDWGLTPEVVVPTDGLVRVVVAVTNLQTEDYDGDRRLYVDGDQVLSLQLRDAEASGDTADTGTPSDNPGPGEEEPAGCGCQHSRAGAAWLMGLLLLGVRRRR